MVYSKAAGLLLKEFYAAVLVAAAGMILCRKPQPLKGLYQISNLIGCTAAGNPYRFYT